MEPEAFFGFITCSCIIVDLQFINCSFSFDSLVIAISCYFLEIDFYWDFSVFSYYFYPFVGSFIH
jgi:hypothetical protein